MNEREFYVTERDRADSWARYYFNLRLGSSTFALLSLGALYSFSWVQGYGAEYAEISFATALLRLFVASMAFGLTLAMIFIEKEFRRRYDIAWRQSLKFESLLRFDEGFHSLVETDDDPRKVRLRTVASIVFVPVAFFTWCIMMFEGMNIYNRFFGT